MMGSLVKLAVAAVLLGVGYQMVFVPTFAVHDTGGIVITGASSGIGEHAAAHLVGLGYTVFAGCRKQADVDRLTTAYPGILPLIIDVTKPDSIAAAVGTVGAKLGADGQKLVALLNNAGVQKDLPIELQTTEAERFNFEVNVFGVLETTRAFLPLLRATGDGARIINTGSIAGVAASPGTASYSASKFAVEALTDVLRMEVAPFGISVSLLQPGYVKSQLGSKKVKDTPSAKYGLSDESYALYQHVFEGFLAKDKKLDSSDEYCVTPDVSTTPAIVDAIRSASPKTRYAVAWIEDFPAWFVVYVKSFMPDRVMDVLTVDF